MTLYVINVRDGSGSEEKTFVDIKEQVQTSCAKIQIDLLHYKYFKKEKIVRLNL